METRAKKRKIDDEIRRRSDPLQSAMKEHLLQELMFQHFTGNEVKQLFEVSTLWNQIASKSAKCGAKLKLIIYNDDNTEKLTMIKASGRKYAALELQSSEDQVLVEARPLLLDIIKGIAWSLKKLKLSCVIEIKVLDQLLSSFRNLESLTLRKVELICEANSPAPFQLPKLKKLKALDFQTRFLRLFRDNTSLELFQFISSDGDNIDMTQLGDFLLRQENLKKLLLITFLEGNQQKLFADKNQLKKMKFQLESIKTSDFLFHPSSAVEFFKRQQGLKKVELSISNAFFVGTLEEYCQVMRSILTLPKLETLKIIGNNFIIGENLIALQGIRNAAVKFLKLNSFEQETSIDGDFIEMFPNLQEIKVTPYSSESELLLIDFRCEKLSLIQCEKVRTFIYEPPLIDFVQIFFETMLEEFILNNRNFNELMIGRIEWIALDIKLSLEFWGRILQKLPNLNLLIITHPGNVIALIKLLKKTLRNFEKVTIRTNNIGRESAKDIQLPSWIEVVDV
jgi:hypothetical protein